MYQPRMYLEIIRTEGVTLLTPDGHKVTLTGRILTIHGLNSSMHGKIVCKVVSTCARIQEEVDLGLLLPVPQKGAIILRPSLTNVAKLKIRQNFQIRFLKRLKQISPCGSTDKDVSF